MKHSSKSVKNPFFILFACLSLICCLTLSFLFTFIFRKESTELQTSYAQKKADLAMESLEFQLETLENIALQLSINKKYHYSVLLEDKYNEKILLQDFDKYLYSSPLTDDIFLYYDKERIFHISGHTIGLDIYFYDLSDQQRETLKNALFYPQNELQIIPANNNLYCLIPFYPGSRVDQQIAVMGATLSFETLNHYFENLGGTKGTIYLYRDNTLIYSNRAGDPNMSGMVQLNDISTIHSEKLLYASSSDAKYIIAFLPDKETPSINRLLQLTLILLNIFLLLVISSIFANKAFLPIRKIHNKYKDKQILPNDLPLNSRVNVFDDLDTIINSTLQQSDEKILSARQRQQILLYLLNGIDSSSLDINSYLSKLCISLPGPFYYVICVSYAAENINDEFLNLLQSEIEQISSFNSDDYVYSTCNYANKQLYVICSLKNRHNKDTLSEYVREVAESYSFKPLIGIGNLHSSLSKISISRLESLNDLAEKQRPKEPSSSLHQLNQNDLSWLSQALAKGSKQDALEGLKNYFSQNHIDKMSLLMQRYIIVEFIAEVSRASKLAGIDLPIQNINLLIASPNAASFFESAQDLLSEYCKQFQALETKRKTDLAYQICRYVEEHFMEYDISLEKVAEELNTSTSIVRESILEVTKKTYKDFVINLRVEYAKKLLQGGELSVAEIANQIGYSSVSYFIRMFKEATSITPAKYAKKNSSNHDDFNTSS